MANIYNEVERVYKVIINGSGVSYISSELREAAAAEFKRVYGHDMCKKCPHELRLAIILLYKKFFVNGRKK